MGTFLCNVLLDWIVANISNYKWWRIWKNSLWNCNEDIIYNFISIGIVATAVVIVVIVDNSSKTTTTITILLWRFIHPGNLNAKCLNFSRMYLVCLGSFQSLL